MATLNFIIESNRIVSSADCSSRQRREALSMICDDYEAVVFCDDDEKMRYRPLFSVAFPFLLYQPYLNCRRKSPYVSMSSACCRCHAWQPFSPLHVLAKEVRKLHAIFLYMWQYQFSLRYQAASIRAIKQNRWNMSFIRSPSSMGIMRPRCLFYLRWRCRWEAGALRRDNCSISFWASSKARHQ